MMVTAPGGMNRTIRESARRHAAKLSAAQIVAEIGGMVGSRQSAGDGPEIRGTSGALLHLLTGRRWAHDQRTRGSKGDYLNDLRLGRLPQGSVIVPSFARGREEQPPAHDPEGKGVQKGLPTAPQGRPAGPCPGYILPHAETAGRFD